MQFLAQAMAEGGIPDAPWVKEKELGNKQFAQKNYEPAIRFYTHAMRSCNKQLGAQFAMQSSEMGVLYNNRALAYYKLKKYEDCEDDCTIALKIQEKLLAAKAAERTGTATEEKDESVLFGYKALYRRGTAQEALEEWENAFADYNMFVAESPASMIEKTEDIYERIARCERAMNPDIEFKAKPHPVLEMKKVAAAAQKALVENGDAVAKSNSSNKVYLAPLHQLACSACLRFLPSIPGPADPPPEDCITKQLLQCMCGCAKLSLYTLYCNEECQREHNPVHSKDVKYLEENKK